MSISLAFTLPQIMLKKLSDQQTLSYLQKNKVTVIN